MKLQYNKEDFSFLFDFIDETNEHLLSVEDDVLKLENNFSNDIIESIYRPFHSIKGTASFVGLNFVKHLTHEVEDLIDILRSGDYTVSSEIVDILLQSVDKIKQMVDTVTNSAMPLKSVDKDVYEIEFEEVHYQDLFDSILDIKKNIDKYKIQQYVKTEKTPVSDKISDSLLSVITDFVGETKDRLIIVEEKIIKIENKDNDVEDVNILMRALHSIKGDAQIILSQVPVNLIVNFPVFYIHKICHCAESIIQNIQNNNLLFEADVINIIFELVDVINIILISTERNEPITNNVIKFLEKIYLFSGEKISEIDDILKSAKKVPESNISFYNNALQTLQLITVSLNNNNNFKPDKRISTSNKINNALTLLKKLFDKISEPDLSKFIDDQVSFFDFVFTNEPTELENELLDSTKTEFENKLSFLEKKIKSLTALPGKIEKPEVSVKEPVEEVSTIKITMDKLDNFMNITGELTVYKEGIKFLSEELLRKHNLFKISKKAKDLYNKFNRLSDELQDAIMRIRMIPVKTVFNKYPRMVRDMSKKLNKKIDLIMHGEETELDKTVIDKIGDPLMHMIRNSLDHGIESAEERLRKGKSESGKIILTAGNKGNTVFIKIEDDGKGIDVEKIKTKILTKNLVSIEKLEQMTDKEIMNYIFMPGFSTAEKITDVSGRGVGLDVVRSNINSFGGTVELDSVFGAGSTITLTLPLTLAVSKGLEIICCSQHFIIPLDNILETVKLSKNDIIKYVDKEMFNYRDTIFPLIDLKKVLNIPENKKNTDDNENNYYSVIIITTGDLNYALKTDKFLFEKDIIVKPLNSQLSSIPGITGVSVMADGSLILILNPLDLFKMV